MYMHVCVRVRVRVRACARRVHVGVGVGVCVGVCVGVGICVCVGGGGWAWAWGGGGGGGGVWVWGNPTPSDCLASMFETIPSPVRRGYVVCNLLNPNSVFLPLPIFAPPSRESAFLHQPAKAAARSCSEPGVVFDNVLDCLLWVVLCISCGLLRCLDCASTPSVSELRTEMHCAI